MTLKTFDVQEEIYNKFSHFCTEHKISMGRQIELFMESMIETEPEAKREYLEKLEEIRKGKFIKVKSFAEQYGL
ncbi:hypothetical protein BEH94_08290 [Candidatus Altiarchaeales archaeon WOR_SM1_SCG]|nr:hypothetical protein BEH94_08290 [Candidatus Altiarchaeales archaeon WOR_SM1_SCG]ODS40925.1 MAG: hypothetical protein A7315_15460 [Candidatus Altiarchaeales archaeon WOR_SM1_79]